MSNNTIFKKINLLKLSLLPYPLIEKLVMGKLSDKTRFFIQEKDKSKIRLLGNTFFPLFIAIFLIFHFLVNSNILVSSFISLLSAFTFFFVFGDNIRVRIFSRQLKFEEEAFLILNSLSINAISTKSIPKSIQLLNLNKKDYKYYYDHFQNLLFELNLGKDEQEVMKEGSKIFSNTKYADILQNLMREDKTIDTDPDFLNRIKKEIKTIEDNIIIFIAVSCLLPLILSLVLSFLLPPNSPSLLFLPILYAIFGTLLLRFIQNKSRLD
ncbi:MAG: hypothetical protein ACTSSG_04450 [Candidatus Heimdallarchaeaceae archaeon]